MPNLSRRAAALFALLALSCSSADATSPTNPSDTAVVVADSSDTTPSDDTNPSDDTTASDTSVTTDAPPADADPFGPYPSGPYGNSEGSVLANLSWEGYVNLKADALSTTKPYAPTSLDALRRTPSKGYGLIHISEFG
jgi:hypothetical protein